MIAKRYLTLIRPYLEYGEHPYLNKHRIVLENIQKLALRICSKKWSYSYCELLNLIHSPTLETCRLYQHSIK